MPKERKTRSISFEAQSRASPLSSSSSSGRHRGSLSFRNPPESPVASAMDMKAWDEVHCPVCMEHPHNSVLLICSSADKGCQPFMCDTSYRHSNCLDQYKKAFSGSSSMDENAGNLKQPNLSCPLCRGVVTGWKVVETARLYMNSKARNCSTELCGFTGCYGELRKHARKEHPSVRPSEADPERQRDWRRMEQRRDIDDIFSTMQSAMGIEDGRLGSFVEDDRGRGTRIIVRDSSLAVFVIVRFASAGRSVGRVPSRSRIGVGSLLWGETHSEPQPNDMVVSFSDFDDDDDLDMVDDDDDGDDDYDYDDGNSNSGGTGEAAAALSGQGPGRPRRRLRLSDDETDDANDDIL